MSKSLGHLWRNVGQALKIQPMRYGKSVFGSPDSWRRKTCPFTEFRLVDSPTKAAHELAQILIPGWPHRPEILDGIPGADLFLRRSGSFPYPPDCSDGDGVNSEEWFFINGICTDANVATLNAEVLHQLLDKRITVLHNATCGAVADLTECAFGKGWGTVTEAVAAAFPPIYDALRNPEVKRVIVMGHSQGTIIQAVILHLLSALLEHSAPVADDAHCGAERIAACAMLKDPENIGPLTATHDTRPNDVGEVIKLFDWRRKSLLRLRKITVQQLQKLEIFAFANCASAMQPLLAATEDHPELPYIESYGNQYDIVAKLGVLAPQSGPAGAKIGGVRFQRANGWGHLLNAHYLWPMYQQMHQQEPGFLPMDAPFSAKPRFYRYMDLNRATQYAQAQELL